MFSLSKPKLLWNYTQFWVTWFFWKLNSIFQDFQIICAQFIISLIFCLWTWKIVNLKQKLTKILKMAQKKFPTMKNATDWLKRHIVWRRPAVIPVNEDADGRYNKMKPSFSILSKIQINFYDIQHAFLYIEVSLLCGVSVGWTFE